ncbi:RNA-binding S4 domain-containing protein [Paraferrimonas sp. SM1919]|uniref:RNA-binding S4 domain-containing protein n=1 Tax=Paraferrimonas sp. SM1919 TaxID=2662263 RepID=UPI0013D24813|nr:RNA-binding S4 domain-containing protein [Paraferrimonas sp. SM1919]
MSNFELADPYIELYKVLKAEGLAASGADAKTYISEGLVLVNGNIETRKRNKIVVGDTIEFNQVTITIVAKGDQ